MTATRAQKAVEAAAFRRTTRSASASSSASVTKAVKKAVTRAKVARKTPVTAAAATSEVEEEILDSITVSTASEPSSPGSDRFSSVVDEELKPIYPGVLPVYDDISQVVRTRVVRDANGRPSIRHRRICAYKNREGKTMIAIFAPPKGAALPEEGALEAPKSPLNETGPWGDPYCDYAGH